MTPTPKLAKTTYRKWCCVTFLTTGGRLGKTFGNALNQHLLLEMVLNLKKNGARYLKTQGSPDGDAGITGDTAAHHSLGAFDDALVLWRFGDAGARCGHRQDGICTLCSLKCSESVCIRAGRSISQC